MKPNARFSKTALEAIRRHLQIFGETSPGIQFAVLTSADGFEIASFQAPGASSVAGKLAAVTSSITALGEAATRETGLAHARSVIIESENGAIVMLGIESAKPALSLAVVAGKQAILGHLLWAARNVGVTVARIAAA